MINFALKINTSLNFYIENKLKTLKKFIFINKDKDKFLRDLSYAIM
jgi:hypothetical protein